MQSLHLTKLDMLWQVEAPREGTSGIRPMNEARDSRPAAGAHWFARSDTEELRFPSELLWTGVLRSFYWQIVLVFLCGLG